MKPYARAFVEALAFPPTPTDPPLFPCNEEEVAKVERELGPTGVLCVVAGAFAQWGEGMHDFEIEAKCSGTMAPDRLAGLKHGREQLRLFSVAYLAALQEVAS